MRKKQSSKTGGEPFELPPNAPFDAHPPFSECAGRMIVNFRLIDGTLIPTVEYPILGMITEMLLERHMNYFHRQLRIARSRDRGNIAPDTIIGEERNNVQEQVTE